MSRVLVTGGAGFIGHHLVEHILKNTEMEIVLLDRLDVSGNLNRIVQTANWSTHRTRCRWIYHDLRAPINGMVAKQIGDISTILHLAAATHVDRSIEDPLSFVYDNVVATCNLLDYARTLPLLDQFLYFSTDEVFGPAPPSVRYKEDDRYRSGNPYAATKAGAEELCVAYHNTYKLPILITHTMNVVGERQHPEKYVPMTISKALSGDLVTVHADSTRTIPGSRFYIHARNVADAVLFVLRNGTSGEKYNIVGEKEVDNLELAQSIAEIVGNPLNYEMVDFHSSRPGHDLRYALDGSKLDQMGWKPPVTFEQSLEKTVLWTVNNKEWLA